MICFILNINDKQSQDLQSHASHNMVDNVE